MGKHKYMCAHMQRPKQALEILETLRRWANEEKISYIKSPTRHRLYDISSIIHKGSTNNDEERKSYIYCGVSSSKQKAAGDLNRQGLHKLLQLVFKGHVKEVVVAHRNKLCRFAFKLLKWICKHHSTKITVESEMELTPNRELIDDLLAIVTVFSCKYNGL